MTCLLLAEAPGAAEAENAGLDLRVRQLVRQLDEDRIERREQAEQALSALGRAALQYLPPEDQLVSPQVQARLERVRDRLRRDTTISSTQASRVTLQGTMALSQALDSLRQQTGNQIVDYRDRFGQQASDPPVRCDFRQQSFWVVLDQLLDQAELQLYMYSGTPHTLAFVARQPGRLPASGRVAHGGLFRFEPTRIEASRDLRNPTGTALKLTLEIAWEPRVRPILIAQALDRIIVLDENGGRVATDNRQAELQVAAQQTVSGVEIDIPLEPPPRSVRRLASIRGTIDVVLPGRETELRFGDLGVAKNVAQQNGGVTVTLQAVRQNLAVHDVRILVRYDQASGALESHRGWIYDNQAYLIDKAGNREDHVGLETTSQRPNEAGLSYKFVIDKELKDYTFVYRTAAAVVRTPVEYELRDIHLP
jgi:hypothetical protein